MFRSDAAETFAEVAIFAEAYLAASTGIECVGQSTRTGHRVRIDCIKRREFPPERFRPRDLPEIGREHASLDTKAGQLISVGSVDSAAWATPLDVRFGVER